MKARGTPVLRVRVRAGPRLMHVKTDRDRQNRPAGARKAPSSFFMARGAGRRLFTCPFPSGPFDSGHRVAEIDRSASCGRSYLDLDVLLAPRGCRRGTRPWSGTQAVLVSEEATADWALGTHDVSSINWARASKRGRHTSTGGRRWYSARARAP